MSKKSRQRSRPRARALPTTRPSSPPPAREAPPVNAPSARAAPSPAPALPPDPPVLGELRKIGLIAAALFAVLVIIYLVWR